MTSQEFNLSVLENVTSFSTPLKDCADYETILSLIKEEIDIAQTEDEGEYQRGANRTIFGSRRKASESCDSEGMFKSPFRRNDKSKSKSPGSALILRAKRRSLENPKTQTKFYTPRARSLGRVMAKRSAHSSDRKHRTSVSHSDTSGFSDPLENTKISNRENCKPRSIFGKGVKQESETEGRALEDLLTSAREQVIINGKPNEENSTLSSQGESSSLATIDPLDTGTMEEDYVESSQNVTISNFRRKLLDHRNSVDAKPKTAEAIKKNLHFDATESEEENQHFSLTLSPEPKSPFNDSREANSTPPYPKKRKDSRGSSGTSVRTVKNLSQDLENIDPKREPSATPQRSRKRRTSQDSSTSTASTLKNLSQHLETFECEREPSTTSQRPRMRQNSQDTVDSALESLTSDFPNSQHQRETSTSLSRSRAEVASQDDLFGTQKNLTENLHNVDPKGEATASPLRSADRIANQDSTPNARQRLTQILENFDPKREASVTPQRPSEAKTCTNITTGSQNCLTPNFSNSQPQTETNTSQARTANSEMNLTYDIGNLEPKTEACATPPRPRKRKISQNSTASSQTTVTQDMENFEPKKEPNRTPLRSRKRKTSEKSTSSSQTNLTQDMENLEPKREPSATPPRPRKRKKREISNASFAKNSTQDLANLEPKVETNAIPIRPREQQTPQKIESDPLQAVADLNSNEEISATPSISRMKETSEKLESKSQQDQANQPPNEETGLRLPRPRKRKKREISNASSSKNLTQDLTNLEPKREASAGSSRSRERETPQEIESDPLQAIADLNSNEEISATPSISRMKETGEEIESSSQQDQIDFSPKEEMSRRLPRPRKRKKREISDASSSKNLTQDLTNLEPKREASAGSSGSRERKMNQEIEFDPLQEVPDFNSNEKISATPSLLQIKETSDEIESCLSQNQIDLFPKKRVSLRLPRSRKPNKKEIANTSSSNLTENLTEDLTNLESKPEASAESSRSRERKTPEEIESDTLQAVPDLNSNDDTYATTPISKKKKKASKKIASITPNDSTDLSSVKKKANTKPLRSRKKKTIGNEQEPEIVSNSLKDSTDLVDNREATQSLSRKKKTIVNKLVREIVSSSAKDSSDLNSNREANPTRRKIKTKRRKIVSTTPQNTNDLSSKRETFLSPLCSGKRETSITSPLKGLTQEFENCIMNSDFEQMCENIENDAETPSFTFETVQMLDDYDSRNQQATNKILSKILHSPDLKSDDTTPLRIEHLGSSEDPLDYDPLYIAKVEDKDEPTPSTPKRKKSTGIKKKDDGRKSNNVNAGKEAGKRRSSTRSTKKRVTMTISDWENEADLSDEAAEVATKVKVAKRIERRKLKDTLHKLDNVVVRLRGEVLPQHDIEQRAGTAPLSYEQQMQFLEFASLNKDTYAPEEDAIIRKNWHDFCEDHDWDPENYKPFLLFKHDKKLIMSCMEERRKFVQFLADGLPNRPLYSVYSRFRILYNEYADAGAKYSPEEDKKILAHMLHNPGSEPNRKYSELAKVLKRSRKSIWKRYQKLVSKENHDKKKKKVLNKVTWDLDMASKFITKLLDITISEDIMELKDAFIPKVVWEKLESKIGINYEFMRRSWDQQFHLQLFCPEPLSMNATKIRLIEYMWMKGIRSSKEIEWHAVLSYFDGCTIPFLRKTFNHLTEHTSVEVESRNLCDILKWLHTTKIDRIRRDPKDKLLPRLRYVDNKVEFVPEDLSRVTMTSISDLSD